MIATLKQLLPKIEAWPDEDQEALAAAARAIEAERTGVYVMSEEERRAVENGLNAARRGDFASDEEVAAILGRARSARA